MSGPKTARYTVSAQQRRAIQIQRQTAQERAMTERWTQELRGVLSDANHEADELRLFSPERTPPALTEFLSVRTEAARLMVQSVADNLPALRERNQKLKAVMGELQRGAEALRAARRQAERDFRTEIDQKASKGLQASFAAPDEPESRAPKADMLSQWSDAVQDALRGSLSEELRKRGEEILKKTAQISDNGFLQSYRSVTIQPFIRECRAWKEEYARSGQVYEEKLARYHAAAEELGIAPEAIPYNEPRISDKKMVASKLDCG